MIRVGLSTELFVIILNDCLTKTCFEGLPWRPTGEGSVLPLQGVQV